MPVKSWGERTSVDLQWQGPKLFSKSRTPMTIPDYKWVYLVSSRRNLYDYPRGASSLAYIGSGSVAERLPAHVVRNHRVQKLLHDEGTLLFWHARVAKGLHGCVEQQLFDDFVDRHGSNPRLNIVRPSCSLDWKALRVRHIGLSFPSDFSRTNFP